MGSLLQERFHVTPSVLAASTTQTSNATATAKLVTGTKVNVPAKPVPGLTYRIKVAGTKSATNSTSTVALVLGTTTILTLASAGATAVDWMAEMLVTFVNPTIQKAAGVRHDSAAAVVVDYAAGAVDCSISRPLYATILVANTSDTVTVECASVESWVK